MVIGDKAYSQTQLIMWSLHFWSVSNSFVKDCKASLKVDHSWTCVQIIDTEWNSQCGGDDQNILKRYSERGLASLMDLDKIEKIKRMEFLL